MVAGAIGVNELTGLSLSKIKTVVRKHTERCEKSRNDPGADFFPAQIGGSFMQPIGDSRVK